MLLLVPLSRMSRKRCAAPSASHPLSPRPLRAVAAETVLPLLLLLLQGAVVAVIGVAMRVAPGAVAMVAMISVAEGPIIGSCRVRTNIIVILPPRMLIMLLMVLLIVVLLLLPMPMMLLLLARMLLLMLMLVVLALIPMLSPPNVPVVAVVVKQRTLKRRG